MVLSSCLRVLGIAKMNDENFKAHDFEHPSILFILEDILKGLLGGPILYRPYYRTFGLKGNENVLDFGCGGGVGSRCCARLLGKDGHLTCVDVSCRWIAIARKRLKKHSNVKCRSGDIRELNIPDHSFDVITTFHVLHDIAPDERHAILESLAHTFKAGGMFFIREPTRRAHGMPAAEIRTLLSGTGLKEIACRETKTEYLGKYTFI